MPGKAGADGLACGDIIQQFRVCAVGNDHICAAAGHHAGSPQLGGHAAGSQCRACTVCQRHHFRGDLLHQRDECRIRVGVGVRSVQAVDVAQQHQQIGLAATGYNSGQRVVVANGGDLIGGNAVVFIDDGQCTQLQQAGQGVLDVHPALGVLHVHAGKQDLRYRVIVGTEQPVVGVHQLALPHGSAGLLGGGILWACRQRKLAYAHANSAGGHQNDLVSLVL